MNNRVQKNPGFLKKPNPLGFLGFQLYWVFGFFYLNKQLGSLLVDLAHQLSF